MKRYRNRDETDLLDAETQYEDIVRILATREFPWDINQALSFALFRTYAVPSIGKLLADTGEFTGKVQKRYDDTALLLDAVLEHGLSSKRGIAGIRRINRMHASYPISNDDMRYVLATFVVSPQRWIDAYGWRKLTTHEIAASTNYYRELGRRMAIDDIPADFDAFCTFMDDYERKQFAFDAGGRAVADSTLDLLCTFPPNNFAPASIVKRFAYSLMDQPLRDAFRYPRPLEAQVFRAGLALRGRVVRWFPVRTSPKFARELPNIRSYPNGYDVENLGTFPAGCPVPRRVR